MSTLFDEALAAEGVVGPLGQLARSIYAQESSSGKNSRTSNRDARGGMQILPGTFAGVADKGWSIDDPMHNARAGIRYLKQLDKQSGGNPELTAAGYYGGPGGLEKARRGIAVSDPMNPGAPNTLQYGAQVAARAGLGGDRGSSAATTVAASATPGATSVPATPVEMSPTPVLAAAPQAEPLPGPLAAASEASAWEAFLKSMPQRRQIAPADLSYGAAPQFAIAAPQMAAPALQSRVPNFQAFSSFGKRHA